MSNVLAIDPRVFVPNYPKSLSNPQPKDLPFEDKDTSLTHLVRAFKLRETHRGLPPGVEPTTIIVSVRGLVKGEEGTYAAGAGYAVYFGVHSQYSEASRLPKTRI